ncbi:type II/III secretion system family protein [Paraburkholderia solisilvae]|uniref:Type 3 secretion system secretin n=1 Tax=Paraburkholderia solisilvae TaxID=624376 RepID=A0A6J5ES96_9BURK|nr:type II/III secretion system family protein [Paraburkholderia solisilvae]CAB3769438.1 Type 3 secretion system secretin [Paraburkholderia solisilvae]
MNAARLRHLALRAAAAAAFAGATHAQAASVDWSGNRFVYATNGSSVADVLNVFAAGEHVPLRVSEPVAGIVSGRFAMPPQQFLDTLCNAYGLVWYYDGAALQVSPANAQQRIAMRPNFMSPHALVAALDRSGVTDAHFPPQVDDVAHTVRVQGPASYVERMRAAARRFEDDARAHVRTTVRIVRLTVATAADQTRTFDGRTMTVPGAATLLRRRFQHRAGDLRETAAPETAQADPVVEFDAPLPVIEADAVTNSILIRDKPERIDGDGMLVADLDVRPALVSVQTWVVDVDPQALAALQPALAAPRAAPAGEAAQAAFMTVADGGHALLAQLDALQAARHARLELARTALTLDGSAAVIDRHEARLAQRDGDAGGGDDAALDLWMSVQPALSGPASAPRIGLRVELGEDGEPNRHRIVETNVAPGDGVAIAAPPSDDPHAPRRLVLLVPRIAG